LNAIFLPAVIEFNMEAASVETERCIPRMAEAMRISDPLQLPDAVREMNSKIGLPAGLADIGVARASFQEVIERAMLDHCHKTNPRPASAEDYRQMLETSL
jgi:hypothetical protein